VIVLIYSTTNDTRITMAIITTREEAIATQALEATP
jgi:hypothetical protein